jgi:lysophospholipase L1-like esterase
LGAAALAITLFGAVAPAAASAPSFYVAVGGSGSVGYQPTTTHPRGQPTDEGYANDLVDAERPHWPELELVRLGCPGETTLTMVTGSGHCHYLDNSQLSTAVNFLHQHPTTVLVTIDLGFNDIVRCMRRMTIDQACVDQGLTDLRMQLPNIITALREAGAPAMKIVGIGHFDPYLGRYLAGTPGISFAAASLGVVQRLNDTLRLVYAAAGVPLANVAGAFGTPGASRGALPGARGLAHDVARVCALTWMCVPAPDGPNQHPNDAGYRVISAAISDVLHNPSRGS